MPFTNKHHFSCSVRSRTVRRCAINVIFSFFSPYSKHCEYILFEVQKVEKVAKQLLKEPNSVQMIDARAAKLSDCNYPMGLMHNYVIQCMRVRLGGIAKKVPPFFRECVFHFYILATNIPL